MRDVAVVSFAQLPNVRNEDGRNEVEMLMPVISEAIEASGIPRKEIGFTVSGSCDYLVGAPFSFVTGLDAVGAWPPIQESHVEMDGAWALYEAWVRLQHGDVDSALVYRAMDIGTAKPSAAERARSKASPTPSGSATPAVWPVGQPNTRTCTFCKG